MRMLATINIQPHLSKGKKITPEKLLPLPWDHPQKRRPAKGNDPELTQEQRRARMAELVKKLGDEII